MYTLCGKMRRTFGIWGVSVFGASFLIRTRHVSGRPLPRQRFNLPQADTADHRWAPDLRPGFEFRKEPWSVFYSQDG
jgi:hypothetical protein